jgi:ribosome-interacting GTPase 1
MKVPLTHLNAELVKTILAEYKIYNADVRLNCDATEDDLIDVIEGNRYVFFFSSHHSLSHSLSLSLSLSLSFPTLSIVLNRFYSLFCQLICLFECDLLSFRIYIPCIYVLNKIDQISIEELDILYRIPHCVPISAHHEWNLDDLLEKIWTYLDLIRVYVPFHS